MKEIRAISMGQQRWVTIACAYPTSPTCRNTRGVNMTDWLGFDRALYDRWLDPNDYRKGYRL